MNFMSLFKKNFYVVLVLAVSWFFVSCKAETDKDGSKGELSIASDKNTSNLAESWRNPKTFAESVFMIPDSIATEEQRALKQSVFSMLISKKHVVMRNGQIVFVADENTLKDYGIPPTYLPIIKESLAQTNNSLREWMKEGAISPEYLDSVFLKRSIL